MEDGSEVISQLAVDENISTIELYDWQRRAIDFFFKNNFKAIFEIATGAGKTLCAIEILKRILELEPKARVLIVVPKNVILEDTWYPELYEAGFSLVNIGVYYGPTKEYAQITITNMQNLKNIALDIFKICILDEIHNFGTKLLLPYVEYPFKYKIGLSATLERMDSAHYKIIEIFDYNVFKYTPQEALHDGILNPFNFYNIGVEMDDVTYDEYVNLTAEINSILQVGGGYAKLMRSSSALKKRLLKKMGTRKELVNNYPRKFDVVKAVVNKFKGDKFIIFNEFNRQTSDSYWYLLDIGVKACFVHSNIDKQKRTQNMIDFKRDKYDVMLASKVLDEGYNLPKIDTAIIAAGNSTSRQTIQRMGRVLRRKKKHSRLVQLYCANTIEQDYSFERAKLFKELCSDYREIIYRKIDTILELEDIENG